MSDAAVEVAETPPGLLPAEASAAAPDLTRALEGTRRLERSSRGTLTWGQIALTIDVTMLVVACVLIDLVARGSMLSLPSIVTFSVVAVAFLYSRGLFRPPLQLQLVETTRIVITASTLAFMALTTLQVVLGNSPPTTGDTVPFWFAATGLLVAGRLSLSLSERRARRAGEAVHPTLIVGAGSVGRIVAGRLLANPELGLEPIGFLDKTPLHSCEELHGLPVLGASWDLDEIVREHGVEHVIVTFSTAPTKVLLRMMKQCEELGVRTSFVPRLYEKSTEDLTVQRLGGIPLVESHSRHPRGWQFAAKHAFDRIAAAIALILLSPVLAALSIAVWVSLGRPILFRQERVGRDGKRFMMLKFRSMRPPTEDESVDLVAAPDTAPGGVEGSDRRTRVGAFIRKLSLDELPQLLNIVNGDMSFVGPRPERPEFAEIFERDVYRYADRHRVKSGITGWSQVHGLRGKTSLSDRAEWDNYYIENWSFWLDFKILLLTLGVVWRPTEVE